MRGNKLRTTLLIVGILFHLFYIWSIFDIYFVSPLVHGMRHYQSTSTPPAKRLFLIVGDGLRADTTFDNITHPETGESGYLAPFLRSIVLNNGTYGISHTRMPTESRPGHVAMIAGFYEDVSAVTKGWKENPVNFDTVFNQSTHTYSFGSPDILPMFKHGALDPHRIDTWMYGHEFEDFTQSSTELDSYVFRHLEQLFHNSTLNATLDKEIRQDGNIFFLHLLGCDTAGHSYRPYSAEYYDNVKYIDGEIEMLVEKVRDFFGDDDTAFIFTADHGMSAFGSHGDGHPNNTRTPLIAWGAGINRPQRNDFPVFDNYTRNWGLGDIKRNDVKQADIAPLMSFLIGANFPANSVGELPLSYLSSSEHEKFHALYNNARGILEQYLMKETEVAESQFGYKQYYKFREKSPQRYLEEIHAMIDRISEGELDLEPHVINLIEELMTNTLEGLQYLSTYNWIFIRTIVTFGFVGWIIYSFTIFLRMFILDDTELSNNNNKKVSNLSTYLIIGTLGVILNWVLYYQRSPFNFYMYLLFPLFFWSQIFANYNLLVTGIGKLFKGIQISERVLVATLIVLLYEGIVYGYSHRWIFTVIFVVLSVYPALCGVTSVVLNAKWIITSLLISTFTLLDAVKIESLTQINIAGILMLVGASYSTYKLRSTIGQFTYNLLTLQILLTAVMLVVTNKSVLSLQRREGLPVDAQFMGWSILITSISLVPWLHSLEPNNDYRVRLLIIFLSFAPTFLILTISFESLFYVLFTSYAIQWIELEAQIFQNFQNSSQNSKPRNYIQLLRVSSIGFFLLQVAFFGTGNIASISSFSLDSVYRLLPIFDPFPMGALLVLKLIIPYAILSFGLGILNLKLGIKDYAVSTLIISTSDILSLNFFYLLRTEGSWLDIGVTISNYVLAVMSSLFMLCLEMVGHILMKNVSIGGTEYSKPEDAKVKAE